MKPAIGKGLVVAVAGAAMITAGLPQQVTRTTQSRSVLLANSETDLIYDTLAGVGVDPAATTPDFSNIAISINGISLLHEGNANAISDSGNIAVAIGNGSTATATGGFFNFAGSFDGGNTYATDGNLLSAFANGDQSIASATSGFFNVASATGDRSLAIVGAGGSYNFGIVNGDSSNVIANFGSGNFASATGAFVQAAASGGDYNHAAIVNLDPSGGGNAIAQIGDGNTALVFGDDSFAYAGGQNSLDLLGNNDLAIIFGNFDHAISGASDLAPGDFDLAAVFGSMLGTADATGGNYLLDILPALSLS